MKKLAKALGVQGDQLCYAIQTGLRPQILSHVIQSQPTTVDDVVKAARVIEASFRARAKTTMEAPIDRVVAELAANHLAAEQNTLELRKFTSQLSKKTVDQVIHVGKVASVHEVLHDKPETADFSDIARIFSLPEEELKCELQILRRWMVIYHRLMAWWHWLVSLRKRSCFQHLLVWQLKILLAQPMSSAHFLH